ncbi:hypothetical protein LIER_01595 [Lithospermum erythrorhizon]|uniref:MYB-CC type transcription factor LHEQLE-containing domain-containing protein n=1 Tax=Lithospermum erythrorhizon TaxID=34254 RepID=A0AAV3NMQ2_LITER
MRIRNNTNRCIAAAQTAQPNKLVELLLVTRFHSLDRGLWCNHWLVRPSNLIHTQRLHLILIIRTTGTTLDLGEALANGNSHAETTTRRRNRIIHSQFILERLQLTKIISNRHGVGLLAFGQSSLEMLLARKSEKRTTVPNTSQIDITTGLQITEALQLQLEVQRQLHEQLEVQRKLQLRIEAQGEQLKMMIDQQRKTTSSLLETRNPNNLSPSNNHMSPVPEVQIPEVSDNSEFPSKIS